MFILHTFSGFSQRLENLENKNSTVMEKSWKIDKKSWHFTNFTSEFYQLCAFFIDTKKFSISLECLRFPFFFCKKSRMQNLSRERVTENRDMFMENSWKKEFTIYYMGNSVFKCSNPKEIKKCAKKSW